MNNSLVTGLGIGTAVGGALYVAFGSDWFLIAAVVALYTGWGYFVARDRRLLVREFPAFDRATDRFGYAVGLFGLAIVPVAYGRSFVGTAGLDGTSREAIYPPL